jgi:hypothetical protein
LEWLQLSDQAVKMMTSSNRMTLIDDLTSELVKELSEAKRLPEQFKARTAKGLDVGWQIKEADEKIAALERRARKLIKELGSALGCGHPQTRMVFKGMADMLIEWQTFRAESGD